MAHHVQNSDRTLVLLHGAPLTPEIWADTVTHLSGRTVITPDCTHVPNSRDAQSILAEQVAADLEGDLDLVGHSFGGQIAIDLALAHPDRVRTLTVLCTRDTPFPAFGPVAAQVRAGSGPSVVGSLARWFTAAELIADSDAVCAAREQLSQADTEDWAAALAAIATYDRWSRTSSLAMPVTVVAAGKDGVSTPEVMADLARRIHGAEFDLHPDWSHMSAFIDPKALAGLIQRATAADHAE
ncbi:MULTISPECIES: alpha/beta fold hydrolase [Gordonia]|jgi:pimeloyl-ACP methyl ester carboxylesterase|uniref:Alpha/beta hydrolase n=2 Tax=Gordonia TaxID=2053 RepID=A0A9X3D6D8_9ACTN|nr:MULTISPECIES: alpha/beta hydrolase [Gordonia]MAU80288.1 alpha/beta hydrolase [Gordonia sp. (in: high G+C Gram-positive bacteria)]MCF3937292.1 alpha/beta hydrolase [Gordonia tangerina]MCX2965810.1 alpha/beta hydrolase [Gordonia aquimaris]